MRSIGKNKMAEPKIEKKEMPFLDHLEELRWRILKCIISIMIFTIVAFIFSDELIRFLIMPSQKLNPPINLQVLKVQGMLYVKIGVALSGGIIVSLPVILYQIWKFVVPGLLEKERRYILPLLFFSTIFFIIGAAFAYYIIIPVTLRFLIGLGIEEVKDNISINYYFSFVLRLILLSGLIFEMPIISFFLSKIGLLTPAFLRHYRKVALVSIFVLAAIITPPDPTSQLMLAVPLIILYEFSIIIAKLAMPKVKNI